jgi:outer membrane protein OmpA-like peptidoglycan-associated protein
LWGEGLVDLKGYPKIHPKEHQSDDRPYVMLDAAFLKGPKESGGYPTPRIGPYTLNLKLEQPQPNPSPTPKNLERTIYFEHEGQPDLDKNAFPGNRLSDLQDWAERIKKDRDLFAALKKQYVEIRLRGYASKTDNEVKNFDLSDARVQNVQRRLDKMFGGGLKFDAVPMGKREASDKDASPTQRDQKYMNDRRVYIFIDKKQAVSGIERVLKEAEPSK